MPRRSRLKVVLCAALTADGKLDATSLAIPAVLYGGKADAKRHPWGAIYDGAAGVLVDEAVRKDLPMPQAAVRTVVAIHLERATDAQRDLAEAMQRLQQAGVAGYLLCFGGAELFRVLLAGGWVTEMRLIVLPEIDGRRGGGTLSGKNGEFFPASVQCRLIHMESRGDECLLHYRLVRRK